MWKNMTFIYGNVQKCIFFCKKKIGRFVREIWHKISVQKSRTIFAFFSRIFCMRRWDSKVQKNDFKNWKNCATFLAQKSCAKFLAQKFLSKKNAQKCTILLPYIKIPT